MTGGLQLRNIYIFSPINVSHLFSTYRLVATKSHSTERIAFFVVVASSLSLARDY